MRRRLAARVSRARSALFPRRAALLARHPTPAVKRSAAFSCDYLASHEHGVLPFEGLYRAGTPALCEHCRKWVGEISSSPRSMPSMMFRATVWGDSFGMSSAHHVGIDGAGQDDMDAHAACGEQRADRLGNENAAAFETQYAGRIGTAASAPTDTILTIAPRERSRSGKNVFVI